MPATTEFDFDTPIDRRDTASMKWDRYKDAAITPLWVADMDFASPSAVVSALKARAEHPVFGYTVPTEEAADAVAEMLAQRYDWQIDKNWIVWLPGLVTGLNVSCRAVGKDGDAVITAVPVYPPFLSAPGFSRRRLQTIPLDSAAGNWGLDPERLARAATSDTRLLILCNPQNPTGRVYGRKELEDVATVCATQNLIVCSDEIHCDLVLDKDRSHIPFATLSKDCLRRTITLMAPSKTYNLPGLGCAFAVIADAGLRRRFRAAKAGIVPHVNLFGLTAATAAYRHGEAWLAALRDYLRENREMTVAAVCSMPGLSVHRPEGTYLAWIDTRSAAIEDPVAFFEQAGVGLSEGADFGGPGYVRLNFACPKSRLENALGKMARAMKYRAAGSK